MSPPGRFPSFQTFIPEGPKAPEAARPEGLEGPTAPEATRPERAEAPWFRAYGANLLGSGRMGLTSLVQGVWAKLLGFKGRVWTTYEI